MDSSANREAAPGTGVERLTLAKRFWSKVAAVGNVCECWIWTASHDTAGYGQFHLDGSVRDCVNPWHLEPVTHIENVQRGDTGKHNAIKTHCRYGHPYFGENLFIRKNGGRDCRACMREQVRRARAKART